MVAEHSAERRRSIRVPVHGAPVIHLARRVRVRLLDISTNGVLLATDEQLTEHTTGRLRVMLGPEPFEANVEVRRIQRSGASTLAGASLLPTARGYRDGLDQFLKRAGG